MPSNRAIQDAWLWDFIGVVPSDQDMSTVNIIFDGNSVKKEGDSC